MCCPSADPSIILTPVCYTGGAARVDEMQEREACAVSFFTLVPPLPRYLIRVTSYVVERKVQK
jgi:hypothetical protein